MKWSTALAKLPASGIKLESIRRIVKALRKCMANRTTDRKVTVWDRTFQSFQNLLVAMVSVSAGFWAFLHGTRYWRSHDLYFFNYREAAKFYTWPLLWLGVGDTVSGSREFIARLY